MYRQSAAFWVVADGTPPFIYQWLNGGKIIPGATNQLFVIRNAAFADAGDLSVVVSNIEGSATSAYAPLEVRVPQGGDLDGSFVMRSDSETDAVAIDSVGRVLLGGADWGFGWRKGCLDRLDAQGAFDQEFRPEYLGVINAVALQNNGGILVAGSGDGCAFSKLCSGGGPRGFFKRLHPDGRLDPDYVGIEQGSCYRVSRIVVESDGKAVVIGDFDSVQGHPRSGIARINADGKLDPGFAAPLAWLGPGNGRAEWRCIAHQADGKAFVGGAFSIIDDVSQGGIARLNHDGSLDRSFFVNLRGDDGAFFPSIHCIAIQPDGKILIGGDIRRVNGVKRAGAARLNLDGSLDETFRDSGFDEGNAVVSAMALQPDGKVLVGGMFLQIGGFRRGNLARLNPDGTLDRTFLENRTGMSGGVLANALVSAITLQSDGRIIVGGVFSHVNDVAASGLARLWGGPDIPPVIREIRRIPSGTKLFWEGLPGRTYRVQYTEVVAAGSWQDLPANPSGIKDVVADWGNGWAATEDAKAVAPGRRFYRVLLMP